MAGNLTVESCGAWFAQTKAQASSNYGIGTDGRIAMYVEECNRAWTSSNKANDQQAVTIEVANNGSGPNWPVSGKAYESLINLCVDICKRNNIKALEYTGDSTGNLTRHNMFANTTCPGPYLQGKFAEIAAEVNKRLGVVTAPQADVMTIGDNGANVKDMQEKLIKLGYDLGRWGADGDFGTTTQKAVKKFQGDRGLKKDGIVGAQTLAELDEAIAELKNKTSYSEKQFIEDVQRCLGAGVDGIAGPITLGKTITVSMWKNRKHPVVKFIQKRLYAMGYTEVGEADGVAGNMFTKAVKHLQKDIKGVQDGEITKGKQTWKALLGMK
jgi:peptidoglycan hydrolase-like protein with peptidoglycan-binding domain